MDKEDGELIAALYEEAAYYKDEASDHSTTRTCKAAAERIKDLLMLVAIHKSDAERTRPEERRIFVPQEPGTPTMQEVVDCLSCLASSASSHLGKGGILLPLPVALTSAQELLKLLQPQNDILKE